MELIEELFLEFCSCGVSEWSSDLLSEWSKLGKVGPERVGRMVLYMGRILGYTCFRKKLEFIVTFWCISAHLITYKVQKLKSLRRHLINQNGFVGFSD